MPDDRVILNADLLNEIFRRDGRTINDSDGVGVCRHVWRKVLSGVAVRRSSYRAIAEVLKVDPPDQLLRTSGVTIDRLRRKGKDNVLVVEPDPTPDRFEERFLELNFEMVRDPDLLAVYDLEEEPHPAPPIRKGDRQQQGKLHAFTYTCLNVFKIGYAIYEAPRNRDVRAPRYRCWYGTLKDFVNKSSRAQKILRRKDSEKVYDAEFLAFAKSLIQNQHGVDRGD
jgi:hypothetical protein